MEFSRSPSPNIDLKLSPPSTALPPISGILHDHKRPYLSDESEVQENRPFKKARFVTPNSPANQHIPFGPISSTSASASQAQSRLQDCTKLSPDLSIFKLFSRQDLGNSYQSSTNTDHAPSWIKRVHPVPKFYPTCEATTEDANKTADAVNLSDSTLVDSTSEPCIPLFVFLGLDIFANDVTANCLWRAIALPISILCPSTSHIITPTTRISSSGLKLFSPATRLPSQNPNLESNNSTPTLSRPNIFVFPSEMFYAPCRQPNLVHFHHFPLGILLLWLSTAFKNMTERSKNSCEERVVQT